MRSAAIRTIILALAVASAAVAAAFAQTSTSSSQPVSLSGTYQLAGVNIGQTSVSMDFSATVTNTGATDVAGPIVLRHANDISRVWYRFGEQSIAAGKYVTVRGNVSVPRDEYNGWLSGGSPALFFYTENDRGDIKTYRIGLSAAKLPPAPSK